MSADGKLFLVKNSKAGCTTLAQILYRYSTGDFASGDVHAEDETLAHSPAHWRTACNRMRSPDTVTFTFSRHPEARVLSAFGDFLTGTNRTLNRHRVPLENRGFETVQPIERQFSIFLDYIEECLHTDQFRTDRHLRAQVINTAFGFVPYDHIGRLETFDRDLAAVFRLAGTEPPDYRRFNTGQPPEIAISREQRRHIERVYAEDFETFGY